MATMTTIPAQASLPINSLPVFCTIDREAPVAPEDLIMENLALVRVVARRMHRSLPSHVELDDLISAGYIGLLDAAEKFEQSRQTSFASYAEFRIRGAILDSLRDLDLGSRSLRRKAREIEQARCALTSQLGRSADDVEVAAILSVEVGDLRRTLMEVQTVEIASFQSGSEEEDGQDLLATLADASIKDPLSNCLEGEFRQRLQDGIEALPERERLVLTLSYYEELTLKEIGEVLSITESRVSQLRSSAVRRLRQALNA